MFPLITDSQFNTIGLIIVAFIGIVPATLAAYWARTAKSNSGEALHEVKSNGGMTEPDPTLKDYIMFVGEKAEQNSVKQAQFEEMFRAHLQHSRLMDQALARIFLSIKPDAHLPVEDDYEGFDGQDNSKS